MILLHGGPGMPSDYLQPLEALAEVRQVVFYDQMGTGRSELPADLSLLTLDNFVADLDVVVGSLAVSRVHLLGHSWGGLLALAYAARFPEKVASVIMSSPLVDVATWCDDADLLVEALPEHQRVALAAPDGPGYRAAEAEFYRRHFCKLDPWPLELVRTMDRLSADVYQTMWGPNEFTLAGTLRGVDLRPEIPSLTMPTLWICGSDDEARPETIRAFSELHPTGRFLEFAGASHCVHLEQTDAYLAAVGSFLEEPAPV